jgi:hypothetical protein
MHRNGELCLRALATRLDFLVTLLSARAAAYHMLPSSADGP